MVVRRTDKGEIGLTAAAWLEDRTTTTYQPSHLRPRAPTRKVAVPPPPPPPMFASRNLAPALAGAAHSRAPSLYAPAPSPRLTLPTAAVDNPFVRPRSAVGASFWNALAFAGLFASVLFGRVIVQAGQESAQAAAPRAAATRAAVVSHGLQNSGAGGVGINALAPAAEREAQPPAEAVEQAQPAAAQPEVSQDKPVAASDASSSQSASAPAAAAAQPAPAMQPRAATSAKSAAAPAQPDSQPPAAHAKRADSTTHLHRGHASRARSESSDWRQEPVETAKPAVADPSAALGTLRINSRPWSQVFIDGRLIGNTPQLGVRLPAGRYTVRMANPELGMSKTIVVSIASGEFVSRVETLEEP